MEEHARFMAKVRKIKGGCWEWTASKSSNGYGFFYYDNKRGGRAHRYSYQYFKGKIPKGLTIDHQCNNRICVNPAHLKAMTMRENVLRSDGIAAKNARKKRCLRGHMLSGYNLMINHPKKYGIQRSCRKCKVDMSLLWLAKKRGE